ncbi:hypothetical protein B0H14DRAFT_2879475, partial [Mycena olivaceomarginata]
SQPQQHSTCVLPDCISGNSLPLVLVCGMAMSRADWINLRWGLSARDLAFLIGHLEWKEAAFFGVVTQQMLVLPYHPTDPTHLPFRRPTHVILGSTRAEVLRDPPIRVFTLAAPRSPAFRPPPRKPPDQRPAIRELRRTIESTVDPTWMKTNGKHLDFMIQRVLQLFDFAALLEKLPAEMHVLVLHGQADQIIPFECSQEIVRRIPSARFVEVGPEPGKLPTLQFGHNFTLYFPPSVPSDLDFSATSTKENLADLPITEPPATKPVASEPPPNIGTNSP